MKSSLKRFLYNLFRSDVMTLESKITYMVDFTMTKPSLFRGASWIEDILPYIRSVMVGDL